MKIFSVAFATMAFFFLAACGEELPCPEGQELVLVSGAAPTCVEVVDGEPAESCDNDHNKCPIRHYCAVDGTCKPLPSGTCIDDRDCNTATEYCDSTGTCRPKQVDPTCPATCAPGYYCPGASSNWQCVAVSSSHCSVTGCPTGHFCWSDGVCYPNQQPAFDCEVDGCPNGQICNTETGKCFVDTTTDQMETLVVCYAAPGSTWYGMIGLGFIGQYKPYSNIPFVNNCFTKEVEKTARDVCVDATYQQVFNTTNLDDADWVATDAKPTYVSLGGVQVTYFPYIHWVPNMQTCSGYRIKHVCTASYECTVEGSGLTGTCVSGRCQYSPTTTTPTTCNPGCASGYTCTNGQCVQNSTQPPATSCPSTPCASGQTCQNGQCVATTAKQVKIDACWENAKAGWRANFSWDYPSADWKPDWKEWNILLDANGCASYLLPAGIVQVNVDGSWKQVVAGGDGWFGKTLKPKSVKLDGVMQVIPEYAYDWKGEGIGYPFFP